MPRDVPGEVQSFGAWIESRRRAMNLTREALAEKVGCAAVTIKKIERDERKPSQQVAALLAEHLLIPGVERERFMRMARGLLAAAAGMQSASLGIPPLLLDGTKNLYRAEAVFAGREALLARLEAALQQALAGHPLPLFLLGDAGSGKTSLMREFARRAAESHPELLVAGGVCNAQTGPGDPFRPFRDALGILTGDLEIDWTVGMLNREQALRNWAAVPEVIQAIAASGPDLCNALLPVAPLVRRLAPHVLRRADWFDQLQALADVDPARHRALQETWVLDEFTQVLRAIAHRHPLVLILDDLQWLDDASLNLLSHLARRLAGSPILLIAAYRTREGAPLPEVVEATAEGAHTPEALIRELTRQYGEIQIKLNADSESEGAAFIAALLDLEPNRLGPDFRRELYRRTRGHPLFATELLRSLRENGNLIRSADGYWVENSSSAAPTPARIEAVIEGRLASLDPLQRQLLDVASVEGQVFTAEAVSAVLGLDPANVLASISRDLSQKHHLVEEQRQLRIRSRTLARFEFHHALIQEYLYNQINPGEKRRLHRRLAEELGKIMPPPRRGEQIDVEYLDALGPTLMHQSIRGEVWDQAAVFGLQLGQRARQRYAMREAMSYFEEALRSLDQHGEPSESMIIDAILGWQDAAFNFKPYPAQLERLARAEEIARRLGDKPRLVLALHAKANVLLAEGRWSQAATVLTESLSLARELGDEGLSVRPLYFQAFMTSFANPADALAGLGLAEQLSRKHRDASTEARALATEGFLRAQLGEFADARKAIDEARKVSGALGSPLVETDVDLFAAWAALGMARPHEALELGQRSVDLAFATDNMDCICSALACIGYCDLQLGRIPEAAAAFQQGVERSDLSGAAIHKLNAQAGLAMTRFISGHLDAVQELEHVRDDMKPYQNNVGAASTNLLIAACLAQLGELERAAGCLQEAAEFFRRSGMRPSLAQSLTSLAELMQKQGRPAEAAAYMREAASLQLPSADAG